ncbi:hypothetical protein K2173_011844 [Erythroxylum novogranatense]|uniref:Biotin carboxyl carrier protein of acetyl-CoA carboxylase n=1 Tax=Erythroxylum novogranatense TaxID=1862640 RepID=A0AAV8SM30_9ROSI|nr:hypothetical protein K2173_011844 [Erythroxylum novogranatense]
MASSLSATPSPSPVVKSSTTSLPHCNNPSFSRVCFPLSPNPKLRFFTRPGHNCSTVVKGQLNEVAVEGSSNAASSSPPKTEVPSQEAKDAKQSNEPSPPTLATEESISEFITQVSSLVKLVDSRDIVELQLKQLDCELIIRKKEALPQPPSPVPVIMSSPSAPPAIPPTLPAAAPAASSPASSAAPPPAPAAAKSPKSSHPPLKCPMAGTFYRSPGPGEPPFVKVGDKVQKGQVLCIIEAMKLMNEIEADQSGTIVEILVEDGKSVSVDMPLFVIEP